MENLLNNLFSQTQHSLKLHIYVAITNNIIILVIFSNTHTVLIMNRSHNYSEAVCRRSILLSNKIVQCYYGLVRPNGTIFSCRVTLV